MRFLHVYHVVREIFITRLVKLIRELVLPRVTRLLLLNHYHVVALRLFYHLVRDLLRLTSAWLILTGGVVADDVRRSRNVDVIDRMTAQSMIARQFPEDRGRLRYADILEKRRIDVRLRPSGGGDVLKPRSRALRDYPPIVERAVNIRRLDHVAEIVVPESDSARPKRRFVRHSGAIRALNDVLKPRVELHVIVESHVLNVVEGIRSRSRLLDLAQMHAGFEDVGIVSRESLDRRQVFSIVNYDRRCRRFEIMSRGRFVDEGDFFIARYFGHFDTRETTDEKMKQQEAMTELGEQTHVFRSIESI